MPVEEKPNEEASKEEPKSGETPKEKNDSKEGAKKEGAKKDGDGEGKKDDEGTKKVESTPGEKEDPAPEVNDKDKGADKADKADGDPKKDGKSDKADGDAELSLKASKDSLLSADQVGSIEALAKENKMTQKQAQATLEWNEKREADAKEANKPFGDEWVKRDEKWRAEVKADEYLGGTDKKLAETVYYAGYATKEIFGGNKEMIRIIEETAMGTHPEFLRAMAKAGRKMAPDTFVHGEGSSEKEISDGQLFYGKGTEVKMGAEAD